MRKGRNTDKVQLGPWHVFFQVTHSNYVNEIVKIFPKNKKSNQSAFCATNPSDPFLSRSTSNPFHRQHVTSLGNQSEGSTVFSELGSAVNEMENHYWVSIGCVLGTSGKGHVAVLADH